MTKPINAYSMSQFESLTKGSTANFGRGKDKNKRKKRGLMIAGGIAGASALGAGIRYGGAEINSRKEMSQPYVGGGAKRQLNKDFESIKSVPGKIKNYDYKGAPGRVGDYLKKAPGKMGQSLRNTTTNAQMLTRDLWHSGHGGKAAVIGTGLAGAGLLGGAGYAAYKAMKNRKKK